MKLVKAKIVKYFNIMVPIKYFKYYVKTRIHEDKKVICFDLMKVKKIRVNLKKEMRMYF